MIYLMQNNDGQNLTKGTKTMPSKHIDDKAWRKIQDLTVKVVVATQRPIKETDVLHYALKKGLEELTVEELKVLAK